MKFLIIYGTTEGQTRKIAGFVADRLRKQNESVTLTDATDVPRDLRPNEYDAAILAASLHGGVFQGPLINYARANQARLSQMPSAFLSISLSAASSDADDLKVIANCVEQFKQETGWTPSETHHIAGAFRFTAYDFFKRWVMRLVAWEKGVKIGAAQELELTDWDALAKTVDNFRTRAAALRASATAA